MNWRRFFFENYKAKTALLLMAVFLWFFVVTSRDYDQVLNVPIRFPNLKKTKVFLEDPPTVAKVRFHGKGTSLLLLSLFGDAHVTLDLATISQFYDYPLRSNYVRWAPGISVDLVEIISPDTVRIQLDDESQRTLWVKPMLLVRPADGYTLVGAITSEPDSVQVRGAKSVVDNLKYIPTQVKSIDNVTGPVNIRLYLTGPYEGKLTLIPPNVRISAKVDKVEIKEISDVPVTVIHGWAQKPGFSVPSTVNVKIKGAKSILEGISRDNITISVSTQGQPTGAGIFAPVVQLPEDVQLVEIIPDTVRINYE